ncbi:MAG: non-ribosomal peptide synthetase, partial [Desulfobacterales bacterium]|nr:non-ribosomal peptide synthetase [Desulfobacterales bacterium]
MESTTASLKETALEEIKRRAKAGDPAALQELRDRGFFRKETARREGWALSHAQKQLWIFDKMEGGDSAAYNMPGALLLTGRLDVGAFRKALETVAARHESLRTTFIEVDGEPRQVIHDEILFKLREIDPGQGESAERKAREYASREAARPFDLSRGPLMRAALLKLGKERRLFLFNIHHIVCDAWSMNVLTRETAALYTAHLEGKPSPLPPLNIQYKDYAAWQTRRLAGEEAARHLDYWREKLSGRPAVLNPPLDHPRPPARTFDGKTIHVPLDNALKASLDHLGRERGASLFMTLTALVKVLLHRWTGQEEIVIGAPLAGRSHPDLEGQIGFFVNTLPLRDRLKGEDPFTDVLSKIRQTAEEAYAHDLYPFDLLVEKLDPPRDMSRAPFFDVVTTLQNMEPADFTLGDLRISEFPTDFQAAKYDLAFDFMESADGLSLALTFNPRLFDEATIRNTGERLRRLMTSVVETPGAPISQLEILPGAERHRLLTTFNDTGVVYPRDATVVELFEYQVKKAP